MFLRFPRLPGERERERERERAGLGDKTVGDSWQREVRAELNSPNKVDGEMVP